jgi:hypothetical protein
MLPFYSNTNQSLAMSIETLAAKDKIIARQRKWLKILFIIMVILLLGLYPLFWFKL